MTIEEALQQAKWRNTELKELVEIARRCYETDLLSLNITQSMHEKQSTSVLMLHIIKRISSFQSSCNLITG